MNAPRWTVISALCGLLLLVGGIISSCTKDQIRTSAATGVVTAFDCELAHFDAKELTDAKRIALAEVKRIITGVAPSDLPALRAAFLADLKPIESDLWHCAYTGAVAALTAIATPTPGEATSALVAAGGPDLSMVRAAFGLAARDAGWAPVKVTGAVL